MIGILFQTISFCIISLKIHKNLVSGTKTLNTSSEQIKIVDPTIYLPRNSEVSSLLQKDTAVKKY